MKAKLQLFRQYWNDLWKTSTNYPHHENLRFFIRISFLIGLYFYIDFTITKTKTIPFEQYEESLIIWEYIKYLFTTTYSLLLLPLLGFLGFYWKKMGVSWRVFSNEKPIRFTVIVSASILAWIFSTYDYNLLYNQGHLIDRLLLLAFIPLIWQRPIFVLPFLFHLHAIMWQMEIFDIYPVANFQLPAHILMLFCAYFLLNLVSKSNHIADFFFLLGCVLVSHYWYSGWRKISMEWLLHDQVSYLTSVTYANGWLGFLEPDTIASIIKGLMPFNAPLRLIVLGLELGCIFFFVHRNLARFFLIGLICFHLGAFLMFGIFFWVWILIDLGVLVLLWRKDGFSELFIFNKSQILFSCVLIFYGAVWNTLTPLSWSSSPLGYTYYFEATTEDGKKYHLPPQFFTPYDFQMTFSNFKYLQKEPLFPIFWGATGASTTKYFRLNYSDTLSIDQHEELKGRVFYDENQIAGFEYFMETYLKNWNERLSKKTPLNFIKAPEHVWTFPREVRFPTPLKIKKVEVTEITTLYKDGKHLELRKRPVYEIVIKE